jgi:hypothetical protein
MFELLVALAQRDRNENALMMLSSLQFCNPELTRYKFVNALMRREYERDEFRLGPLIALFNSLAEDMVVYDNGCKTCPASATHVSAEFEGIEVGSSQDALTQDVMDYANKLHKEFGGSKKKRRRTRKRTLKQQKRSTRKKRR